MTKRRVIWDLPWLPKERPTADEQRRGGRVALLVVVLAVVAFIVIGVLTALAV